MHVLLLHKDYVFTGESGHNTTFTGGGTNPLCHFIKNLLNIYENAIQILIFDQCHTNIRVKEHTIYSQIFEHECDKSVPSIVYCTIHCIPSNMRQKMELHRILGNFCLQCGIEQTFWMAFTMFGYIANVVLLTLH